MRCSDEAPRKSGGHHELWSQQGGKLEQLELQVFEAQFTRDGASVDIYVEWAADGENMAIGYNEGVSAEEGYCMIVQCFGRERKALALVGIAPKTYYPLLLNLASGEVEDFAAGINFSGIEGSIHNAYLSEDASLLLVKADQLYLGQTASGKLLCVDELCGASIANAGFTGDGRLACWSVDYTFPDDEWMEEMYDRTMNGEKLDLTSDFGMISLFLLDVGTKTVETVFADKAATLFTNPSGLWHGTEMEEHLKPGMLWINPKESRYMLELGEGGDLYVWDLTDCSRALIRDFKMPEGVWPELELIGNADGSRLLIHKMEMSDGSLKLKHFWVLDFENASVIEVERDPLGGGGVIDWFGSDTVMVEDDVRDDSGRRTGDSWYYLYHI